MPTVVFAPAIARWLSADPQTVGEKRVSAAGETVREVLAYVQYSADELLERYRALFDIGAEAVVQVGQVASDGLAVSNDKEE